MREMSSQHTRDPSQPSRIANAKPKSSGIVSHFVGRTGRLALLEQCALNLRNPGALNGAAGAPLWVWKQVIDYYVFAARTSLVAVGAGESVRFVDVLWLALEAGARARAVEHTHVRSSQTGWTCSWIWSRDAVLHCCACVCWCSCVNE